MPRLSIVIPTYNEAGRIGKTLDELADYLKKEKIDAEVIVADASSPDGTAKIVKKHEKYFKNLHDVTIYQVYKHEF